MKTIVGSKRLMRSVRGRMWLGYMGVPGRGRWHYYLRPWFGGDQYYRKTLVLPLGLHHLVIALWEFRDLRDCPEDGCNPYRGANPADRVWLRWKRVRQYGRIER